MQWKEQVARLECDLATPSPVVTATGHAATLDATEARVRPLFRRVPISRVSDLTPLDGTGVHTWAATTPLALDLTVHAGKGSSAAASRLSAVMEAIERVSAENLSHDRLVTTSYDEMRMHHGSAAVLDPARCELPFETTYRPDRPCRWVVGFDLVAGCARWVAADLVQSPAVDGVCTGVETNGLAAGNTTVEATLHALLELIERDAISRDTVIHRYADPGDPCWSPVLIDPATVPPEGLAPIRSLEANGLVVRIQDMTPRGADAASVTTIGVQLFASQFPGADREVAFAGYGTDLDPMRALARAVSESAQSHAVVLVGARDAFEGSDPLPERAAMLRRQAVIRHGPATADFPQAGVVSDDQRDQLTEVIGRLVAAGFAEVVVVDLTRPDLGIPVVRVIVPGLAHPYGATRRRPTAALLRLLT